MSAIERLGLTATVPEEGRRYSDEQDQTKDIFGFKWAKRDSYESPAFNEAARTWLFERYCGGDPAVLDGWLAGERKIILDAGCGSAFSALLFFDERLKQHDYLGVDISAAAWVAQTRFAERGLPGDFMQASLMDAPVPAASVDIIFSEGVLHHTDDTGAAIRHLATKLKQGGRFLFYVYAKKGPIREFTDDHLRGLLQGMDDETAWEALKPLSRLGAALGELNVTLDVPEDVPMLGIKKGPIDLQRFFYWHVAKAYYRPDFSLEEMNHINFDWYRPLNCHRHTVEEVQAFCAEAGLAIETLNVQEAGLTVVARKV
jgi:arsenite methyltransferase